MIDILQDALMDSVKLIPFLFITYAAMEFLERSAGWKSRDAINKAGSIGPLIGGLLGALPQCGFSAAASSLYAGRVIGAGTLVAVFLSTSDEMLPIFISSAVPAYTIAKLLLFKICIAIISGYAAQLILGRLFAKKEEAEGIDEICEAEHCGCGAHGVIHSALIHTARIFIYILIISIVLNFIIDLAGEERITGIFASVPALSELITAVIGLIPNCASSVVITKMYLSGIIGAGALMSGLLVNAGVGLLILLRLNRHLKENLAIIAYVYIAGVLWGLIIDILRITF